MGIKRIYLSHPYGGKAENREKAAALARMYREIWRHEGKNFELINPLEIFENVPTSVSDEVVLNAAIELLKGCDAVIFCDGWEKSHGCCMEHNEAYIANKDVFFLDLKVEAAAVHWYGRHRLVVPRREAA